MESSFSPREIVSELDKFIIGQKKAKRAVAVAAIAATSSFGETGGGPLLITPSRRTDSAASNTAHKGSRRTSRDGCHRVPGARESSPRRPLGSYNTCKSGRAHGAPAASSIHLSTPIVLANSSPYFISATTTEQYAVASTAKDQVTTDPATYRVPSSKAE